VIQHGRFDIDLTGPAHIASPEIRAFVDDRIVFTPDPAVPRGGVHVTLTTRNGATTQIRQDHALGTPQNAATGAQIEAKFRRGAAGRLGPEPARALLAQLTRLDQVADCAELLRLTRLPSAALS
jgi:2-methylcitrate dehydratase PrpD